MKGEAHSSMRGRKIAHREPGHSENGGNYTHTAHASHNSPASNGASIGPGPLPGAGELPGRGPGAAAKSYAQRDPSETPMAAPGAVPKNVRINRGDE